MARYQLNVNLSVYINTARLLNKCSRSATSYIFMLPFVSSAMDKKSCFQKPLKDEELQKLVDHFYESESELQDFYEDNINHFTNLAG